VQSALQMRWTKQIKPENKTKEVPHVTSKFFPCSTTLSLHLDYNLLNTIFIYSKFSIGQGFLLLYFPQPYPQKQEKIFVSKATSTSSVSHSVVYFCKHCEEQRAYQKQNRIKKSKPATTTALGLITPKYCGEFEGLRQLFW